MRAMLLRVPGPAEGGPLEPSELPEPEPGPGEIKVRVRACGVCRTDLHIVEGDLELPKLPVVPGHQIVGVVEELGRGVKRFREGDRVGVPWLYNTCGRCRFCREGEENLCYEARFTGFHVDGGFAEHFVAKEDFAYPLPEGFPDVQAAPLLCAGIIGYRALRLSEVKPGERLGMYGFGASAHVTIQVARHWGCEVFVFTRSPDHRRLAEELGARWTGGPDEEPPEEMDSSIIFAPSGPLVPKALKALRRGGTLALAGIHMTPVPQMDYGLLYWERKLGSVANSTRRDAEELLKLAAEIPIRTEVEVYGLEEANEVLLKVKRSEIRGAAVLKV